MQSLVMTGVGENTVGLESGQANLLPQTESWSLDLKYVYEQLKDMETVTFIPIWAPRWEAEQVLPCLYKWNIKAFLFASSISPSWNCNISLVFWARKLIHLIEQLSWLPEARIIVGCLSLLVEIGQIESYARVVSQAHLGLRAFAPLQVIWLYLWKLQGASYGAHHMRSSISK